MILADTTNELLCRDVFGESYRSFVEAATDPDGTDKSRLEGLEELNRLNRGLCLLFLHHHNLKGVENPMPLYQISNASARPGNPRFDELVSNLANEPEHLKAVRGFLQAI